MNPRNNTIIIYFRYLLYMYVSSKCLVPTKFLCDCQFQIDVDYKIGKVQSDYRFDAYVVGKRENRVFVVDRGRCKGCRICTSICPYDAIYMSDHLNEPKKSARGFFYPIENENCVGCKQCVWACPDFALSVLKLKEVEEEE